MSALFPAAQQFSKVQSSDACLVILDSGITDLALLKRGVRANAVVHVLDAQRDGVAQITELLQEVSYERIHLVSHGAPGCLYLGNTELSLASLSEYALQLTTWDLAETDLLLYGCNLAAGDAGEEFVTKLHQLTGAQLYAADQPVGDPNQGGTWMLMPQQLNPATVLRDVAHPNANASSAAEHGQIADGWAGEAHTASHHSLHDGKVISEILDMSSPKEIPLAFEDFILSRYTGLFGLNQLDRSSGRQGLNGATA